MDDSGGQYQPGQTIQPNGDDGSTATPRDPNDPAPQPVDQPDQPKPQDFENAPFAPSPPQPADQTPPPPPVSNDPAASPPEAAPGEGQLTDNTADPAQEQASQEPNDQDQGGLPPDTPPPPPAVGTGDGSGAPTSSEMTTQNSLPPLVSWEASEYMQHQHGAGWYLGMLVATIGLAAALVLLLNSILSAVVVVLMMLALLVYAQRAPRVLQYGLSEKGISVGSKFFRFSDFRSFSIFQEKSLATLELEPVKRFMPRLSIFLDMKQGQSIVSYLERFLPRLDRNPDAFDRLSHKLKI